METNNYEQHQKQEADLNTRGESQFEWLDAEFILLIIIVLIFFQQPDAFTEKFQLLDNRVKEIQNYLDTADETLQALNQACEIPKQNLN